MQFHDLPRNLLNNRGRKWRTQAHKSLSLKPKINDLYSVRQTAEGEVANFHGRYHATFNSLWFT